MEEDMMENDRRRLESQELSIRRAVRAAMDVARHPRGMGDDDGGDGGDGGGGDGDGHGDGDGDGGDGEGRSRTDDDDDATDYDENWIDNLDDVDEVVNYYDDDDLYMDDDADEDPFDVSYHKRMEEGAYACLGRNILDVLYDRSVRGPRYVDTRRRRDYNHDQDDDGCDASRRVVGGVGGHGVVISSKEGGVTSHDESMGFIGGMGDGTEGGDARAMMGLVGDDGGGGGTDIRLPDAPIAPFSRRPFPQKSSLDEIKNNDDDDDDDEDEDEEEEEDGQDDEDDFDCDYYHYDDDDDDDDDYDDQVIEVVDVTSEIVSHAEYASSTKFKANYLTHLNGGIDVPRRPRGLPRRAGGGVGATNPLRRRRRSRRQRPGGGGREIVVLPRPVIDARRMVMMANMAGFATAWAEGAFIHDERGIYSREQVETNRQLREHLLGRGLLETNRQLPEHLLGRGVLGVPVPPDPVSSGGDVVQKRRRRRQSTPSAFTPMSRPTSAEFEDGVGGGIDGSGGNVRTNDGGAAAAVDETRDRRMTRAEVAGVRRSPEEIVNAARRSREEAMIVSARRRSREESHRRRLIASSYSSPSSPLLPPRESTTSTSPTSLPPASRSVSTISIAFSPDSRTVASTHGDHTVKISCCYTGKLIRTLEGHPRTPWTVKYHPTNGRIVASGCLGYQVRVWDWNFQKDSVRKARKAESERRWRGRYDDIRGHGPMSSSTRMGGGWGGGGSGGADFANNYYGTSPRGVVEHPWRTMTANAAREGADDEDGLNCAFRNPSAATNNPPSEEDDDYASRVLIDAGIPPDDPAWYDTEAEAYNYDTGIGVCLNMIRLNSAVISLSFHPSGEILAMASGNTLHLWDYNAEKRKRRQKTVLGSVFGMLQVQSPPTTTARESEARILNRSETSIFPRTPMVEFQHSQPLRCVHFPPCGTIIIVGGVNPPSANDGLPNRDPRRRGGMSGGGMSFHLRMWDFSLDAVLSPTALDVNEDARTLRRGGRITDEGDLVSDHNLDDLILKNPRQIIPRVLLYNDGGFDVSRDGKILAACADFWLPDGIDSAMELIEGQQLMEQNQHMTNDDNNGSFDSTSSPVSSPSQRQQMASFTDPRTPPPIFCMSLLEPPSPPGKRNLSNMPRAQPVHFPHPLSIVAADHPVWKGAEGRYVPHIVTVSLDTSTPPNGEPLPLDPNIVRTESMRQHPNLGRLLHASPLDGAKSSGVTCVKLSPSAEYCLLGYGVRENIPSVHEHEKHRHPVTSLYNVRKGMKHVCTLTCADDDVNIARFHPESGHGFVYGTKQGRVRVLAKRPWNYYHLEG